MGQFRGLSLLLIPFQISVDILFYRLYHTSIDIVLSIENIEPRLSFLKYCMNVE